MGGHAVPIIAILIEPHHVTRVLFDCRDVAPDPADRLLIEQTIERSLSAVAPDDGAQTNCALALLK
jgi:PIN domain nuclease of toxin-antitoxin system